MGNTKKTLREIEIEKTNKAMAKQKEAIETFKAIYGLEGNDSWELLKELYFKKERDRIANAITGSEPLNGATIDQLQEKLIAIRHFKIFIQALEQDATYAKETLEDLQKIKTNLENGEYSFEDEEENE